MLKKILTATVAIIMIATLVAPLCIQPSSDDTLEVLVIAGQSQAMYSGGDRCNPSEVNGTVPLPSTNAYYYGTATSPIVWGGFYTSPTYDTTFSSYGLHNMIDSGEWVIGGYEPILANKIAADSNCDVLIINVGISGAPISFLQPSATGGIFMDRVISNALAEVPSHYTLEKIGFMWLQGESDKDNTSEYYIEKFDIILDHFQSEGFDTCYMVETAPNKGGNAVTAQRIIAATNPAVIMASTAPETFTVQNGLLSSDNLHYTQAGRTLIAEQVSDYIHVPYHFDEGSTSLLHVIPLILILAVIATIAMGIIRTRD